MHVNVDACNASNFPLPSHIYTPNFINPKGQTLKVFSASRAQNLQVIVAHTAFFTGKANL
jgi:hypothetical protein